MMKIIGKIFNFKIHAYSDFVTLAKKALIILSFLIIFILIVMPIFTNKSKQFEISLNENTTAEDFLILDDVNLKANHQKTGKYEILAKNITQKTNKEILLDSPILLVAELITPIKLTGKKGFVNEKNDFITIYEDVIATLSDNKNGEEYLLKTSLINFDTKKAEMQTDAVSSISNKESVITSEKGFSSFLRDKYILFRGKINGEIFSPENHKKIFISSDTMKIDWSLNKITFHDFVTANYENLTLNADIIESTYIKNRKKFEKVYFHKNVKLVTKENTAFSDNGYFDIAQKRIILTGNVRINKDGSELKGNKFIYYIDQNRGFMDNENNERVKAKIKIKNHEKN